MAVQLQRLNKTVQLLAQGQPIYYTSVQDRSYEGGRAAAQTWADYINIDMEHHAFDVTLLHDFMRGLVDGGPTASGHRTPAVIAFVESTRYPFQTVGRDGPNGLAEGRRGSGGQAQAAAIWGLAPDEYVRRADPWPLNPDGELLLGLKIENLRAVANAESTAAVPGISF